MTRAANTASPAVPVTMLKNVSRHAWYTLNQLKNNNSLVTDGDQYQPQENRSER
ncbi:hypothetical protein [Undibacterium umbellatum]|uniref:Uncharacterized protein n=1 Tax=Undibacterium umbellatum TaxID=2762300 RepID=A0ABR6ZHP5_9BURK|nr:hypothetical protein [Undibacterium umbellatum]MBC3911256.1 hypothetical protein [Undibacterium umbellatum]